MVQDIQKSWKKVLRSVDESVRSLVQISLSSEGREFLNNLDRGEAGLCVELLDRVCHSFELSLAFTVLNHATGTDETLV
jgi:hypothetical protein